MAYINITDIQISRNGTMERIPQPCIGGIEVGAKPEWSANRGTAASGRTVGTLIRSRRTYRMAFPPLTWAEYQQLEALTNQGFAFMRYTDFDGVIKTVEIELTGLSGTERSWAKGRQRMDNVQLTMEER